MPAGSGGFRPSAAVAALAAPGVLGSAPAAAEVVYVRIASQKALAPTGRRRAGPMTQGQGREARGDDEGRRGDKGEGMWSAGSTAYISEPVSRYL